MFDDRLPTKMWVQAGLARCSGEGIPAVVERKGDPHTGVVLVKIDRLDGTVRLLTQQRNLDGDLGWVPALSEETVPIADADAYAGRTAGRDPDIWIVTIEDPRGRNPFD